MIHVIYTLVILLLSTLAFIVGVFTGTVIIMEQLSAEKAKENTHEQSTRI